MAENDPRRMTYNALRGSRERQLLGALADLEEETAKARRRIASGDPHSQSLIGSSANSLSAAATSFAEAAHALGAFRDLEFLLADPDPEV